jgi:hypothetical protein
MIYLRAFQFRNCRLAPHEVQGRSVHFPPQSERLAYVCAAGKVGGARKIHRDMFNHYKPAA